MKRSTLIFLVFSIIVVTGLIWFGMYASREVLTAFGTMNSRLETHSTSVAKDNDSLLTLIKDEEHILKAKEVDTLVDNFKKYLESIKEEMLGIKNPTDYEKMDQANNMFFTENGFSEKGKEFLNKINQFREEILKSVDDTDIKTTISEKISTNDVIDRSGKKHNWLIYNFKDFPLVASITKLTQMQSDVSSIESDIYKEYLRKQK
ncbi:hypothetical protein [Aquimarina litoralis]|uniref:hypothetical protein n=1 Tax=Aquimarina litoralis TaxID=584605 RepID=UPI001C5A228C|nr:hypothetical protein [Aquimarina litoralis]MBW1295358.1 hypothetical protein [Aquimarina litoralis]